MTIAWSQALSCTVRRIYVIQLARGVGKRNDPRLPWVYVGQTGKSVQDRFADHRAGRHSSSMVKKHGLHLRPDLYEDLAPVHEHDRALALEASRAKELAACGLVAHTDGTSHSSQPPYTEWDRARLEPVIERACRPGGLRDRRVGIATGDRGGVFSSPIWDGIPGDHALHQRSDPGIWAVRPRRPRRASRTGRGARGCRQVDSRWLRRAGPPKHPVLTLTPLPGKRIRLGSPRK